MPASTQINKKATIQNLNRPLNANAALYGWPKPTS